MDIPFSSSNASSRLHYVLVRKVESAPSVQAADKIILEEVDSILRKLNDANLSIKHCKELLIILLYCYTTCTEWSLPVEIFSQALSHAVTLAEAGETVSDKRIGYLFCSELMPRDHELQLMLVNTIRKDLERPSVPHICLALDHLIMSPSEDVVPAVQSRLQELLLYNSPHVRRRAVLAFRSLSQYEPDLLESVKKNIIRRMKDQDLSVCSAGFLAACRLFEVHESVRPEIRETVSELLHAAWSNGRIRGYILRILMVARFLGIAEPNTIFQIIRHASRQKDYVLLRSAFLALPSFDTQATALKSLKKSPIHYVRDLLTSRSPNEQYLFLTCLECVNPIFWAGTDTSIAAILEQWEVEQMMKFLDAPDPGLRKMTVRILNQLDPNIITSYYTRSSQNLPNDLSFEARLEYTRRLLEVLEIQSGEDGESYAMGVKELLSRMDAAPLNKEENQVLEPAVEIVLTHIRQSPADFRTPCATTFLTYLSELNVLLGPTMMVVEAALACEYSGHQVSVPSVSMLKGLCARLSTCPVSVQDASLLAMLRVAAECDSLPTDIPVAVAKLGESSGRHIRRRCEQFIHLSSDKSALSNIVSNAHSSSLPDFLQSLQNFNINPTQASNSRSSTPQQYLSASQSPRISHSSTLLSASKLRYTAYDAPKPTPRLLGRRSPNAGGSDHNNSTRSEHGSPLSLGSNELFDGGDLALAASTREFESILSSLPERNQSYTDSSLLVDTAASSLDSNVKNDLIAFDSPFISEPAESSQESSMNFAAVWESLDQGARGWYGGSMEQLLQQLRISDDSATVELKVIEASLPPFVGDLKVFIQPSLGNPNTSYAVLRLKESEEEGCLWKLRGVSTMCARVKNILTEG